MCRNLERHYETVNEPVYEMVSNDNPINNRLAIYIIDRILCGQTVIRSVMKLMRCIIFPWCSTINFIFCTPSCAL